jgi:hypothetical protein
MMRRIVAEQLAAALADAMPAGTFDQRDFVRRVLGDVLLPEIVLSDLIVELDLESAIPQTREAAPGEVVMPG